MTPEDQDFSVFADPDKPASPVPLAETQLRRPDHAATVPKADRGTSKNFVGKTLGKYRITDLLGQGGMGIVLKAHDPTIDRDVAIKVLNENLAADEKALSRFLSEARAAGKLSHPNVTAIYEIGKDGPTHFIAMEYVPGGSLADRAEKHGGLSVLEATLAAVDACKALGAAHAAGLIHRDIKPANFLRAADGSVKISDFGLAKTTSSTSHQLTQTGTVVGTPFFMSPEQCEARPVDARSDIYSLGATYYSLLTGEHPYKDSDSVPQIMYRHCHGPIPDPRAVKPTTPEACSRIIGRAMAKSASDRYQSVDVMLADLQTIAATLSGQAVIALPSESGMRPLAPPATSVAAPPAKRRRLIPIVAGLVILSVAAAAIGLWRPWRHSADGPAGPRAAVPSGDEPIKVGVLHSLSGTMSASESVVASAVRFALDEVNESGGVLGRQVKPVIADGLSDWPTFAREAERLISEEKVCTVFGCWTSASRKAVRPVFEQHNHLLIYPLQFEGLETSPAIVYLGAAPNQQIIPAVEWAMTTLGKKRFFLVGSDYVFPRAAHAIIKDRLQRSGLQPAGEIFMPLGHQNMDAVVQAIERAKPDMILNSINGDSNTAFFRGLRAAGITPAKIPTLSFSIGEQELRSLNAPDAAGDYAAWTYFQSVATKENKEFVDRFHDKYPWNVVTDPMETAYVGVKLWAAAVNEARSLDPKSIRRALLTQRLIGPGGEFTIDADTQYSVRTPRVGQVLPDGQFKIVWTAPAPVRPEPYPSSRSAEAWRAFLNDLHTGWRNRWAAPEEGASKN